MSEPLDAPTSPLDPSTVPQDIQPAHSIANSPTHEVSSGAIYEVEQTKDPDRTELEEQSESSSELRWTMIALACMATVIVALVVAIWLRPTPPLTHAFGHAPLFRHDRWINRGIEEEAMRNHLVCSLGVLAVGLALQACGGVVVSGNTVNIKDAKVEVNADANVDLNNVKSGNEILLNITVKNVVLVAPNATPPPNHVSDSVFIKIFLDDETTDALVVTAETHVTVKIPAATPPGQHKLICRAFGHSDSKPTSTTFELSFNITGTVTGTITQH